MSDVTRILSKIQNGDPTAAEQLLPFVYDELRKLATARLAHENPSQTLQATALVHEAYIRLVDDHAERPWNSRGHFFGAAAKAMRRILIDRARMRDRQKRGGDRRRLDVEINEPLAFGPNTNVLAIDEALSKFAEDHPVKAELVNLRFFGGLTLVEAAEVLRISRPTADRYWQFARAWLSRELRDLSTDQKNSQNTPELLDVSAGEEIFRLGIDTPIPVGFAAFSPHGRLIATVALSRLPGEDRWARIWDASDGRFLRQFPHDGEVNCVAFSPDNKRVVTAGWDRVAKVWDLTTGELLALLEGHTFPIWGVDFSPNGQRIATGSWDQTARIWNATTGDQLAILRGHTAAILSVKFCPANGRYVATASWDKTAKLWDLEASRQPLKVSYGYSIDTAVFSPDGTWVALGKKGESATVVETNSHRIRYPLGGHSGGITAVAVSSDGQWIVTGSNDGILQIRDAATGRDLRTLEGKATLITAIAVSTDKTEIITGSDDGTTRVWSVANGGESRSILAHRSEIRAIAISPDGKWFASGSGDMTVRIWDTKSVQPFHVFEWSGKGVDSLAISPDGNWLVAAGVGPYACVWNVATRQRLFEIAGDQGYSIRSISFSADGSRILTCSSDTRAVLYEALTGRELLTLAEGPDKEMLVSAAMSADGLQIASATETGTIRVWRAGPPEQLAD